MTDLDHICEYYIWWPDPEYFRRCIQELARIHPTEIQVEGEVVKVTRQGILDYKSINDNLQIDFELPT